MVHLTPHYVATKKKFTKNKQLKTFCFSSHVRPFKLIISVIECVIACPDACTFMENVQLCKLQNTNELTNSFSLYIVWNRQFMRSL